MMPRLSTIASALQNAFSPSFEELQIHASQLQVQVRELEARVSRLREQRERLSPAERQHLDMPWAQAQHHLAIAVGELDATNAKIVDSRAQIARSATTVHLDSTIPLIRDKLPGLELAALLLMLPLVLAFARRIWIRGSGRPSTPEAESISRLQRIEQMLESMALEIERLGEAQRFTTKVLTERQPDAAPGRIPTSPPAARRESGSITPH